MSGCTVWYQTTFPAGHNIQTSNISNTISGFGRSSNHNIHIIFSSVYKARFLLISVVYLWFWTTTSSFKKFDTSWWNQNQLSLLYKIWLYHSSILHWRLDLFYYTNLRAQSIPFSMAALCDDNSDGDDDDDDVFISSHSSTLDPPAASYISDPTPHNANIIYIRQMRLPSPLLAPKRLEFGVIGERWGWGRRHVDDNHTLFCVLWCFINQYSAESCTGNIIQCI